MGLVWNTEDHTVSYRRQKTWWFVPELSAGPLTDVVTTVNLPMLAASDAARGNFFMEFGLSDMFAAMEVGATNRLNIPQSLISFLCR